MHNAILPATKWYPPEGASMRRRDLITLVGGTAAAWPLAARAQQPKVWRIGVLAPLPPTPATLSALRDGMRGRGYVEGQNLSIDVRWPQGTFEHDPSPVAELINSNVDVIVAWGTPAVNPARRATSTIPIVMVGPGDPSKYPPAKPGALGCEPLEAAVGVADAAPGLCWPPKGGPSTPQIHLLQAPVLLFLFPDIFPYHLLVSPYCGDEVPSRPEVLSYEVPLLLSVHASQVYRALSLDKPDHLRHCVFRWDRDQHVHVIW